MQKQQQNDTNQDKLFAVFALNEGKQPTQFKIIRKLHFSNI